MAAAGPPLGAGLYTVRMGVTTLRKPRHCFVMARPQRARRNSISSCAHPSDPGGTGSLNLYDLLTCHGDDSSTF